MNDTHKTRRIPSAKMSMTTKTRITNIGCHLQICRGIITRSIENRLIMITTKLMTKVWTRNGWSRVKAKLESIFTECSLQYSVAKPLAETRKVYSPAVKPHRVHQMIERNRKQPDHLKSSYPVETQAVEQGYLAHVLMNDLRLDVDEDRFIESDRPENTPRSTARHYTPVDPVNLRSNMNRQGIYNSNENSFSDNLIKATIDSRQELTPRNVVLRAQSTNQNTPVWQRICDDIVIYHHVHSSEERLLQKAQGSVEICGQIPRGRPRERDAFQWL